MAFGVWSRDSWFVSDVHMAPGCPVALIIYCDIWRDTVTPDRKVGMEVKIKRLRDLTDSRTDCVK